MDRAIISPSGDGVNYGGTAAERRERAHDRLQRPHYVGWPQHSGLRHHDAKRHARPRTRRLPEPPHRRLPRRLRGGLRGERGHLDDRSRHGHRPAGRGHLRGHGQPRDQAPASSTRATTPHRARATSSSTTWRPGRRPSSHRVTRTSSSRTSTATPSSGIAAFRRPAARIKTSSSATSRPERRPASAGRATSGVRMFPETSSRSTTTARGAPTSSSTTCRPAPSS
jgi:hypothetical protein